MGDIRQALGVSRVAAQDAAENGAGLLDLVADAISRFVLLPGGHTIDALALWVLHTHVIDVFDATAYLNVHSPTKRCGKTVLMDVLHRLVAAPLKAVNVSEAALFRALSERPRTLLLDEVDTIFGPAAPKENEPLRGILNAGYTRGQCVLRMAGVGAAMHVEEFDVFGPKVFAGIGQLPDTIADRSITIPMQRKPPGAKVARARRRHMDTATDGLPEKAAAWADAHRDALRDYVPTMPPELDDRAADIWEPLVAVADTISPAWGDRARRAALSLAADRGHDDDGPIGQRLLASCKRVFDSAGADRLRTSDVLEALHRLDESEWADLRGGPLNSRQLSKWLKPFGIAPKMLRFDDETARGYDRAKFIEPWASYCPEPDHQGETKQAQHPQQPSSDAALTDAEAVTRAATVHETRADDEPGAVAHQPHPVTPVVTDPAVSDPRSGGDVTGVALVTDSAGGHAPRLLSRAEALQVVETFNKTNGVQLEILPTPHRDQ